jgi:hypothetical protein
MFSMQEGNNGFPAFAGMAEDYTRLTMRVRAKL